MKTIHIKEPADCRAFTLLEVATVLAMGLLAICCFSPALARSRSGGQVLRCLNNHRQLINAWQMYAIEHHGKLPMNYHGAGGTTVTGKPWAWGWLDWTTAIDNTNTLFLTDDKYCSIAKYLGNDARVFKCPSDTVLSAAQQNRGWKQRARSYSLNMAVGEGNATSGVWDPVYAQIYKLSDLRYPTVADTYVFTEEHPDSMNDPAFQNPRKAEWPDVPASYHDGAAVYSFADGHAEIHQWSGSVATNVYRITRDPGFLNMMPRPADDPDAHWVSSRVPRNRETAY